MLRSSLTLAFILAARIASAAGPGFIESTVFLPESGWNRDDRVVQYNSFFLGRASALEITSEWMLRSPSHQLSLTLPVFSDGETGFGDATINYRRQLFRRDRFAAAGRLSAILPTRSERLGTSVAGVELALPASFQATERLAIHAALGARWVGGGGRELNVQNAIGYAVTGRLALIVDSSWTVTEGSRELVVRPAMQVSFEAGGLRVAPALAMPVTGDQRSLLVLVGLEHDF